MPEQGRTRASAEHHDLDQAGQLGASLQRRLSVPAQHAVGYLYQALHFGGDGAGLSIAPLGVGEPVLEGWDAFRLQHLQLPQREVKPCADEEGGRRPGSCLLPGHHEAQGHAE